MKKPPRMKPIETLTTRKSQEPHAYRQAPSPACQPSANRSAKFNTFVMASFTKLTCRAKPGQNAAL